MNWRLAWRTIARYRGFTSVVVLTMALGIGANATMFSLIRAVFLRGLPFPHADRLVTLWEYDAHSGGGDRRVTPANFVDWAAESKSFDALGVLPNWIGKSWPFNVIGPSGAERVAGIYASSGFFRVFGVAPVLGRTLNATDDWRAGQKEVVISHAFWQRRFRGDPHVVGKTLEIDTWRGGKFTVTGVMPAGFDFPPGADLWLSLGDWGAGPMPPQDTGNRCCSWYTTFGRLKAGVTAAQAAAELTAIGVRITQRHPEAAKVTNVKVIPVREHMVGSYRLALYSLFGAVGCVLLIGCANVANLLLSRGVSRRNEMLTRMALGASIWHMARQLIVESLVLSTAGLGLGLLIALWAQDLLARVLAERIPLISGARIDWTVLAFAAILTVASAVACGLTPLIHWRGAGWRSRGQTESASSRHLRDVLVRGEVALSLILVTAAGLLIVTMSKLSALDFGIRTERLLAVTTDLNAEGVRTNATAFVDRMLPRLAALPGVEMVAATTALPMDGTGLAPITREGALRRLAAESPQVAQAAVTPGYFELAGIPLLRGRLFNDADTKQSKLVAVLSQEAARRYFPGEDPIGKRFALGSLERFGSFRPPTGSEVIEWREIVGVVGDVRSAGFNSEVLPLVYHSHRQYPLYDPITLLRTPADPLALARAARSEIRALNNRVVITQMRTVEQAAAEVIAQPRLIAALAAAFALLAVLLGMVGIYGVMSYTVTQRRQEIGIRIALGASGASIARMILGQTLRLVTGGALLGILGSALLARTLTSLLFGISPLNPWTMAAACLLLVVAGMLAAYLPARRSMSIDPAIALRNE